jgi:hypothetical protein
MTENHGVPGSNPGLATSNTFQFSITGCNDIDPCEPWIDEPLCSLFAHLLSKAFCTDYARWVNHAATRYKSDATPHVGKSRSRVTFAFARRRSGVRILPDALSKATSLQAKHDGLAWVCSCDSAYLLQPLRALKGGAVRNPSFGCR